MDNTIVSTLNTWATADPLHQAITVGLANYLPYVTGIIFIIFLFRLHQSWRLRFEEGFITVLAAILTRFPLGSIIKGVVARPRPFVSLTHITPLITETDFSFPSGHALFFFALATAIFCQDKAWGTLFFVLAVLIGLGRIAAGIHYPSDILGGAIIGILFGWLLYKLIRFAWRKTSGKRI